MKKTISLILAALLMLGLCGPASAVSLQDAADKTAAYILDTVSNPQVGSIGGEWAVLGLSRSGCAVPEKYYQDYYATLESYVTACKGVLHEKKYTEYSRVIIALTAIGKNPASVAGYNLLTPLGDFEKTVWQGINGSIWALIALDSGGYAVPQNAAAKTQATRQLYVDEILSREISGGGWSLSDEGGEADPDITAMALQALSKYQARPEVKAATSRALARLSAMQDETGGFASWGTVNSESVSQVIVALDELGVSLEDSRFVKGGKTLLDSLLSFRQADGSFSHTAAGSGNSQMSTEQGFYALVSALRAQSGKPGLYTMTDALSIGESEGLKKGEGLAGKNEAVRAVPISAPGTTFEDVIYSENRTAIEALASRGIINGMGTGLFEPDSTMTRAQFAAIITRGLGLEAKYTGSFNDVKETAWYAGYIDTASSFGLVNGRGGGAFDPESTITRQEAAAMIARAAKLCGMDTTMSVSEIRDALAPFGDYVSVAQWAQESFAFCCKAGIWDSGEINLEPEKAILRCEIAQLLFSMLSGANLL